LRTSRSPKIPVIFTPAVPLCDRYGHQRREDNLRGVSIVPGSRDARVRNHEGYPRYSGGDPPGTPTDADRTLKVWVRVEAGSPVRRTANPG